MTLTPSWRKQKVPRSKAPASPTRRVCSDPNRNSSRACRLMSLGSLVPWWRPHVSRYECFFCLPHHDRQASRSSTRGIVRSSRELSSKASQRFFRGDSTVSHGPKNLHICILTNLNDSYLPRRVLELSQQSANAPMMNFHESTTCYLQRTSRGDNKWRGVAAPVRLSRHAGVAGRVRLG